MSVRPRYISARNASKGTTADGGEGQDAVRFQKVSGVSEGGSGADTEPGRIELRMNRSIQAEGSFGDLKQNSGFRRFLCRGTQNVKAESILLSLAHNMNKLHHKIQTERTGTHLFSMKKKSAKKNRN